MKNIMKIIILTLLLFLHLNFHCVPEIDGVNSEAAIIIDFESKLAIICGTRYSGEIKKSVFSIMNYIMPHEKHFTYALLRKYGSSNS